MRNYRVSFFRLEKEQDEKGKFVTTGQDLLGSVVVDDYGLDEKEMTLTARAFRIAPAICLIADKVVVEQV